MRRIRVLAMDVDGTLTDGRIHIGPDGEVFKSFDVRDGYAISTMLPEMGIVPVVITARRSVIVERRCEELGVTHLYQGVSDKLSTLKWVLETERLKPSDVAYMGDDLNDLECMRAVVDGGGVAACPADAAEGVRGICTFVAENCGGDGALREFAESLQMEIPKYEGGEQ